MRTNYYLENFEKKQDLWNLPVVKINDELNPFIKDRVVMYAVSGEFLPYNSMKSLSVLGMLTDARARGLIKRGKTTIVEATSGATGLSLTQFALSYPFEAIEVVLVMNPDVPLSKSATPRYAGARIIPPEKGLTGVQTARKLGEQEGWLNLDQYANPANTIMYNSWATPKVLDQLPAPPNLFVSPIGTGGTVTGFSNGLRWHVRDIKIVGAMCAPGVELPGMRDLKGMKDIKLPWQEAIDQREEVPQFPSYLAALWFQWTKSLMPGLTSGGTYLAALLALKRYKDSKTLDEIRGNDGMVHVLMIFHDGARPYVIDRFPMLQLQYQQPSTAPKPWELLW